MKTLLITALIMLSQASSSSELIIPYTQNQQNQQYQPDWAEQNRDRQEEQARDLREQQYQRQILRNQQQQQFQNQQNFNRLMNELSR